MLKRYRFAFSTTADKALAKLDAAVSAAQGFELAIDAGGRVKIFRNQGFVLLNGFFPVFVGRFSSDNASTELRGGFRFHLLAVGLFAGFVGASIVSLVNVLTASEGAAGMPEDWKMQRIRFELQFIAFAVLAAVFAWLAGKPMRERITTIIVSATAENTTEKSKSK
ncbi:MAG: hypothetical protein JSU95_00990 [Betaproteobacteria bacterium]|nr:MAG: hypothetical protein JSU95_00990 [Betaproteobacteria bacterium]